MTAKYLPPLLLSAACHHATTPPPTPIAAKPPTTLTLPAPPTKPGPYLHFEKSQHEKLVVKGVAVEDLDEMATDECVVSVDGSGAIQELAVTFARGKFTVHAAAPIGDHSADLGGRTFHETFAEGEPRFTEHGQPVADGEVDLALTGYQRGDVGRPYWLGALLFDRPFAVGTPVELEKVRIGDIMTASKATVVLQGVASGRATFALKATFPAEAMLDTFDSVIVVDTATSHIVSLDDSLGTHGDVKQTFAWKANAGEACPP